MTAEHMPDLAFEFLEDGTLRLEQSACSGEPPSVVDLHPAQLRHLCERSGLLERSAINQAPRFPVGHVRRVLALAERIAELHGNDEFFNQLFDRCEDGIEWWLHIRAICEQADELAAEVTETPAASESCNEMQRNTEATKPGRKPLGDRAMTSTERSRKHRENGSQQQGQIFNDERTA